MVEMIRCSDTGETRKLTRDSEFSSTATLTYSTSSFTTSKYEEDRSLPLRTTREHNEFSSLLQTSATDRQEVKKPPSTTSSITETSPAGKLGDSVSGVPANVFSHSTLTTQSHISKETERSRHIPPELNTILSSSSLSQPYPIPSPTSLSNSPSDSATATSFIDTNSNAAITIGISFLVFALLVLAILILTRNININIHKLIPHPSHLSRRWRRSRNFSTLRSSSPDIPNMLPTKQTKTSAAKKASSMEITQIWTARNSVASLDAAGIRWPEEVALTGDAEEFWKLTSEAAGGESRAQRSSYGLYGKKRRKGQDEVERELRMIGRDCVP